MVIAKAKLRLLHAVGVNEITIGIDGTPIRLRVNTRDNLTEWLTCERYFEPRVRKEFLSRLKPGMTVLDIGANVGYYTTLAATRVGATGRVISVEPQPAVCQRLRDNVHENGLINVDVVEAAAGSVNETVEFHIPVEGWESHGSCRLNGSFNSERKIGVNLRRIDDVLSELRIRTVDLIKIDVEGGEFDAFKGMPLLLATPPRPTLIFEACEAYMTPFGHRVYELLRWLDQQGYRAVQLEEYNWLAQPV